MFKISSFLQYFSKFSSILLFLIISTKIHSQKIRIIDNKGTISTVNNNKVITGPLFPTTPIEGDIWFKTSPPTAINIWDGTTWIDIEHSGSSGSIFFAGTNGKPDENNSQLRWDNSLNRLSIGTPLAGSNKLTVQGAIRTQAINNANGTFGQPSYRFSDDSDSGMYRIGTNQLGFSTAGSNALSIDATQNISIGENLSVTGSYLDSSGDTGLLGQVLSSTISGTNWVNQNLATIINKTADYTLTLDDNGNVFTFNSATDVILTVPAGLPIGYNISIYQVNTGKVIVQGSGTTILNRLSRFKTAGIDAGAGLIATNTNTFHLTGDLKR